MAVLAAALLASCSVSTGDPIELSTPSFAQPSGPTGVAALLDEAATATAADTAVIAGAEQPAAEPAARAEAPASANAPDFVVDADDGVLPAEVAYVPAPKPGAPIGADVPASPAAVPADTVSEPVVAAAEPAPPQPQPQPKRGFLANLFDNSAHPAVEQEDFGAPRRAARRPAPPPAPGAEAAPALVEVAMAATAVAPAMPPAPRPAEPADAAGQDDAAGPTTFLESGPGPTPPPAKPEKKGFLSGFFSSNPSDEPERRPVIKRETRAKPVVTLASTGPVAAPRGAGQPMEALPGVRQSALFEITRKSGLDDDDDIDLHEDEGPVRVASAAGLARLAPNGLLKQTDHVDVACLKPSLVRVLKSVERHYGKQVVVTSGYRSPSHNRRARGARNSLHMYCAAADVQVPGVSKMELARFVRAMPGRGGVGTYCHTDSVHVDVGPERDWNWRCRRRKS